MSAGPLAVLDACVLVNFSLCDTLLRLAEAPALYEPKCSAEIIAETVRTLESKVGMARRAHFPSSERVAFATLAARAAAG
jgi:hypothetical protein